MLPLDPFLNAVSTFYYVLECTLPGSGANLLTVPNVDDGAFLAFYPICFIGKYPNLLWPRYYFDFFIISLKLKNSSSYRLSSHDWPFPPIMEASSCSSSNYSLTANLFSLCNLSKSSLSNAFFFDLLNDPVMLKLILLSISKAASDTSCMPSVSILLKVSMKLIKFKANS